MADFEIAPVGTVAKLAEVKAERDALAAKLARYDMCAGHAQQRRAESRVMREALGFASDADDVSPRDLLDALARLKAEWQAEAVETAVARGYRSRDELAGWAEHLRRQAEEVGNV